MIRVFAAALVAAGALGCDPCRDAPGACIALTVDGPAGAAIDRLDVAVRAAAGDVHVGTQDGPPATLPVHTRVELPDGLSGNLSLLVVGFHAGVAIGSGTVDVPNLPPNGHATAEVLLAAPGASDGGLLDGAVADASTVDAAGRDAGLFDLPPLFDLLTPDLLPQLCPNGALFCDNFENGFNAWGASTTSSQTCLLTTSIAESNSPTHSFAVTADDLTGAAQAYYETPGMWNVATGTLSVRFYFKAPAKLPELCSLLELSDQVKIKVINGSFDLDWAGGSNQTNVMIPVGAWTCVALTVTLNNGGMGTIKLTANNQPAGTGNPTTLTAVNSLALGLFDVPQNTAATIFYDDIAVATMPLTCP